MDNNSGMVFWIVVLAVYFLPAIVAEMRKHHNKNAIGVLNLLLGWTLIGWVAAIVWASTESQHRMNYGDIIVTPPERPIVRTQAASEDTWLTMPVALLMVVGIISAIVAIGMYPPTSREMLPC